MAQTQDGTQFCTICLAVSKLIIKKPINVLFKECTLWAGHFFNMKNIFFEIYRLNTDEIESNLSEIYDDMQSVIVRDELNIKLSRDITQEIWYELRIQINEYLL